MDITVRSLLSEILERFPDATKSEIGEAFCLNETVTKHLLKLARTTGEKKRRVVGGRRRADMVLRVRAFAEQRCGGKVEIIPLVGDSAALCVNGKLVGG